MYVPPAFKSEDAALGERLIAENAFGLLITTGSPPNANHIPMLRRADGVLIGHVAKANPQWQAFDGKAEAVAVFFGPHAYVSPNWYVTPAMVPTWNYAAVHVFGAPRIVEGEKAADVLRALVGTFESDATGNWRLENLPDGMLEKQIKGIVAFEMPVDRIEIKTKLNQNRSAADAAAVQAKLAASIDPLARATAQMMAAIKRD
ncbi:MAG: FMN-binding negative transcriptional regulator [Proteobacteria bacterium]|nr:FMN-binding negative transcriptional regulator [Pseudomonadota bacterium]